MLERSLRDGILTLRLAHGKAGALDLELVRALEDELSAVAAALDVEAGSGARPDREAPDIAEELQAAEPPGRAPRALVLTGTGTIFSAGVDLIRLCDEGEEYTRRFFPALSDMLLRLFTMDLPVVAALNGHAVAGGCILALAADLRLMAAGSGSIGVPELTVGLPFPAVAHEIIRFAVPGHRLTSLVLTGSTMSPEEALAEGICDQIVPAPELEDKAQAAARQLGSIDPLLFRHSKRYLRAEALERLSRRGAASDEAALALWLSERTRSRVRAYVDRVLRRRPAGESAPRGESA